jgi:FKBP-type peptidyl-prolyl cis-trans isomerase
MYNNFSQITIKEKQRMKNLLSVLCILALTGNAYAQKKKVETGKADKATKPAGMSYASKFATAPGFTRLESGLEYKMIRDAAGTKNPKVGDFVDVDIIIKAKDSKGEDSIVFASAQMNNGQPVQFPVSKPGFNGDVVEGILLMTPGDSAIFNMPVDSMLKANPAGAQGWMKQGENQKLTYHVSLVNVKTADELKKAQEESAAKQIGIDDMMLQEYFKSNNIKATKTASGMYYKIDKAGTGPNVKAGQKVTVNYTGKLLDGTKFDSNTDSAFQHVQPFSFNVGQGMVIKGWDEGLQLMNKGSKGVLYIPSTMAYGDRGQGPIKPNSVLIFDVEVTDIEGDTKK